MRSVEACHPRVREGMNAHVARTCVAVIFLLACVSTPRIGMVTLGAQTSVSFTDSTLAAGTTQVKAAHIAELRWWVNTFRVDCGLSASTFTDATVTAGSTTAKAAHITELRTALGQAYVACGASAPTYTDATLTAGITSIKAIHIQELRAAVTALVSGRWTAGSTPSGTSYTLDATAAGIYIGHTTAIAIGSDNNPVIAYYDGEDGGDLKVYVCANTSCSSGTARSLDSGSDVVAGNQISMVIGSDNNPVIAYHAYPTVREDEDLKLYLCADTSCSSGSRMTLDAGGRFPALAIGSDNNPIISYTGGDWASLKLAVCANASCTSGLVKTLDSILGVHSSIAIGSDNNPVIATSTTRAAT